MHTRAPITVLLLLVQFKQMKSFLGESKKNYVGKKAPQRLHLFLPKKRTENSKCTWKYKRANRVCMDFLRVSLTRNKKNLGGGNKDGKGDSLKGSV